jgi:hypothetical protein
MKQVGRHSRVNNTINELEQFEEYDVDHEITAAISKIDNTIDSCDMGRISESISNEKLIIKACISHLLEKL